MAFPLKQDINGGKREPASVTEPLPVPSRTEAVTHSPFIHRQKAAVGQHQASGVGKHTYIPAPGRCARSLIMSSRPAWTMKQDPVLKKIRKEKKKKGREGGKEKKMKKEWITS